MNNSSSYEVGKAVKRRRNEQQQQEEEEYSITTTDRLSHLPDPIIHHILSFLDTKSAVQTSVLSRLWRSTWKHVPVLRLVSGSFRRFSSFRRFVDNVLSLRRPFNVRETLFVMSHHHLEEDVSFVAKVAQYSLSHDAQHLVFQLLGVTGLEASRRLSNLFGTISHCSLETLRLSVSFIDCGFGSFGFRMLKTLELRCCQLVPDEDGVFDPFPNFPRLENLVLDGCCQGYGYETRLKISGPKLLNLELCVIWFASVEIDAPRLKLFDLHHLLDSVKFAKLSFPSLDHAIIDINDQFEFMEGNEDSVAQCLITLFQGLSNVTILRLEPETIKVLFGLYRFKFLQSSPFTRLVSLNVTANSVPYSLLAYFLEGSSAQEPTLLYI
ncbi:unnamed protein product [Linum tenue]|uniref:F-box domain-containing protein n=1 Tax=Linum tenue TaxID=586396 RepID=A0AAV0NMZ1_9ROSI|nr:unnamed protein product [Linum tenue]